MEKGIMPTKYIICQNHTTLFWEDGTETKVIRNNEDEFNRELAFLIAYFQKNSGLSKTQANKFLKNLMTEEEQLYKALFDTCNGIGTTISNIFEGISEACKRLAKSFKDIQDNTININDIKIPQYFKKPNKIKMQKKLEYFSKNHCLQNPIVVDKNNVLRDGYISYLIIKNYTIMDKVIVKRKE